MNRSFAFRFPLAGGLHARPAAALRERALALGADCELVNDRSGTRARLVNLLSLMATDTRKGDPCRIEAAGPGAEAALAALAGYIGGGFLATDDPAEAPARSAGAGPGIQRILARAGGECQAGIPVAPGFGAGPAVLARPAWNLLPESAAADPEAEARALDRALAAVLQALRVASRAGTGARAAVLAAQAAMLQDQDWQAAARAVVAAGAGAGAAVARTLAAAQAELRASANPCLRERALDLQDLGDRLLAELAGTTPAAIELPGPCVLVAADLTPSRLLALDRTLVLGLVLPGGAATSHTAILARSFGIPCVVCADLPGLEAGRRLAVDGGRGLLLLDPPAELEAYYAIEARERAQGGGDRPGASADGVAVALLGNILGPWEAAAAFAAGAEGIGLFRSEMLFLERSEPPSEEEQYQAYRAALEAAGGRPVVLRLLDVGGDKPLPYLPLAAEANPFLGRRGVRWYPLHPELVRTQLRAAGRAAAHGDLRLMLPMVAEAGEIQAVRALSAGTGAEALPLGIMVEVPAAALNLAALAREADFLSVGSNDLVQYLFAADRGEAAVSKPEFDWHPATLRMLDLIVRAAAGAGRPLSLCGELAGQPRLLPLLVGLGLRSLSMAAPRLGPVRRRLAGLDAVRCRELAQRALAAGSAEEVAALLQAPVGPDRRGELTEPALIVLDSPCASKEEALKLLAERLAALGRARDPLALEAALWAREEAYATGVGFGFAIPHCKCADVEAPTLAVLRLAAAVPWGSLDGQPVDMLVCFATSGADGGQEHLRVFAKLARKLMDETFRAGLRAAPDPAAVLHLLLDYGITLP